MGLTELIKVFLHYYFTVSSEGHSFIPKTILREGEYDKKHGDPTKWINRLNNDEAYEFIENH